MVEIFLPVFLKRWVQIFSIKSLQNIFSPLYLSIILWIFFLHVYAGESKLSPCCVKGCEKCILYVSNTSSRHLLSMYVFLDFFFFLFFHDHFLPAAHPYNAFGKHLHLKPFWYMRQYVIGLYPVFFLVFFIHKPFFLPVLYSRLCLQKKMLNSTWPN